MRNARRPRSYAAKANALLFYLFALMAGGSAVGVVVSRNIVRTAVALLFTLALNLSPALAARGARAEERGGHIMVDLGPVMTTGEMLSICAAAGVAVIELVPVSRALS